MEAMNRVILLLNVVVLVVTFVLALSATDSQIGLLRSASEAANLRVSHRASQGGSALPYLRVVQSLESITPPGSSQDVFEAEKLRAVYDAMRLYQDLIDRGVAGVLARSDRGQVLLSAYEELGRSARQELEMALSPHFDDATFVRRLATEIIKTCG